MQDITLKGRELKILFAIISIKLKYIDALNKFLSKILFLCNLHVEVVGIKYTKASVYCRYAVKSIG